MVYRLRKDIIGFPDPRHANDDGLFAVGGELTPEWLLLAYNNGIFPWFPHKKSKEIWWYCPQDRFVIFPQDIHISHSMRNLINKNLYRVTCNKAFDDVIMHCSTAQYRDHEQYAWLGEQMITAYKQLHQIQHAISIEVWQEEKLVGGLYGVAIGKNIFGESMFSLVPNASKLALIALAKIVGKAGGIIDCQFETPHLLSMGGKHITYDEYMELINNTD
ncbi:MAG: leucyl/phenylalanyl-tRNA--protein transferase [Paludibacteraceae bacterium]|nr:leucyl/phenylalanyl-tRNA--protein transferase [Paludibacteraceae bacterium]